MAQAPQGTCEDDRLLSSRAVSKVYDTGKDLRRNGSVTGWIGDKNGLSVHLKCVGVLHVLEALVNFWRRDFHAHLGDKNIGRRRKNMYRVKACVQWAVLE